MISKFQDYNEECKQTCLHSKLNCIRRISLCLNSALNIKICEETSVSDPGHFQTDLHPDSTKIKIRIRIRPCRNTWMRRGSGSGTLITKYFLFQEKQLYLLNEL